MILLKVSIGTQMLTVYMLKGVYHDIFEREEAQPRGPRGPANSDFG